MTHIDLHEPQVPRERRRPPTVSPDLFEFIHDLGTEMCAADDIFLQGQFLLHKYKPPTSPPSTQTNLTLPPPRTTNARSHGANRRFPSDHQNPRDRRLESLDGFKRSQRSSGPATLCWQGRGGLSQYYQRLQSVSEATETCLSQSGKRAGSFEASVRVPTRPKWYMVVFGSVTVPAEMEMKDIKSRQKRRNTSRQRLGSYERRTVPVTGVGCDGQIVAGGGGGGSWKILQTLSCKGDVDRVVTAPSSFGLTN